MPKKLLPGSLPRWRVSTLKDNLKLAVSLQSRLLGQWLQKNWFRLLIIGLLTLILLRKDLRLQLDLQNGFNTYYSEIAAPHRDKTTGKDPVKNISYPPALKAGKKRQAAYIRRFAKVAQLEMDQYGIPASITLAQGLLESNAGESPLAANFNNHFGLKCFSRVCQKGHCANFSDDSHKDFFRRYTNAWESYRAHSLLLTKSDRYKTLSKLPRSDYRSWAKGLAKAGYATDKQYAQKLINLIESMELYAYDS